MAHLLDSSSGLWTVVGQASNVAQLVGVDALGLVSMVVQAALAARRPGFGAGTALVPWRLGLPPSRRRGAEPWQQVVGVGDGGSSCRQWWLRTVCGDVTRLVESGPALRAA